MDDVVLVESCWYDGVEAPDIYRPDDDWYAYFHVNCHNCQEMIKVHDSKKHTKGEVICPDCGSRIGYSRYWSVITCWLIDDDEE